MTPFAAAPRLRSDFPDLGVGLGLRTVYYDAALEQAARRSRGEPSGTPVDWYEAVTENYMGLEGRPAGRPLRTLLKIREQFPIVLHGVALSLGSTDPLSGKYLRRLKELVGQVEPAWISDHLCWTGVDGTNLHDLLPLPYTEEALTHVVERIQRIQDFLGRRILVENVSSYVEFATRAMSEWEFLGAVAERADCALLLDVNNVYVSSRNHGFEPEAYLSAIPFERVGQIHLAGHSDHGHYVVDTHDHPVSEAVWRLYEKVCRGMQAHPDGAVSAMIERDDRFPEFAELEAEVARARAVRERAIRELACAESSAASRSLPPRHLEVSC